MPSELRCHCVTARWSLHSLGVCQGCVWGICEQGGKIEPKSWGSQGTEGKWALLSKLILGEWSEGHCCVSVVFDHSWRRYFVAGCCLNRPHGQQKHGTCPSMEVAEGWLRGRGRQGGWLVNAFCSAVVFCVAGFYFQVTFNPSGSFHIASQTCWLSQHMGRQSSPL